MSELLYGAYSKDLALNNFSDPTKATARSLMETTHPNKTQQAALVVLQKINKKLPAKIIEIQLK